MKKSKNILEKTIRKTLEKYEEISLLSLIQSKPSVITFSTLI